MCLSKYSFFLFFSVLFSLVTFHSNAQGVTKNGKSTTTATDFVDKNGKIGSVPVISKDGRVLVLATLTTTAASSITSTTATSGGNVTSDGGTTITARGVCWATTSTPTIAGSKTIDTGTTGIFTSSITALTAGTVYYIRAYATNSAGTSYGNEVTFTTATVPGAPTIGTATAGNAQATVTFTATSGNALATVTFTAPVSNGGSAITGYTVTSSPGGLTATGTASPITVSGLTNGTAYTFTVKATNAIGTSVASSASNSVTPFYFAIGQPYQGGIIAYIDGTGQHGLIAAPSDQSTGGAPWGCEGTSISGADGTVIGTGNQNTIDIINGCTTAGVAAKICYDLILNGYSDWYLPSIDELKQVYLNRAAVGGFASAWYWASTESGEYGYIQSFTGDNQVGGYFKNTPLYVRAVRTF